MVMERTDIIANTDQAKHDRPSTLRRLRPPTLIATDLTVANRACRVVFVTCNAFVGCIMNNSEHTLPCKTHLQNVS